MSEVFVSKPDCSFMFGLAKYVPIQFVNSDDFLKKCPETYIAFNWFFREEIFEARRKAGLKSYCVERGALPNSLCIDANGFNCNSSSYNEENWDRLLSIEEITAVSEYKKDFQLSYESLEPQVKDDNHLSFIELAASQYNDAVFVPLQVPTDSVLEHFGGWLGRGQEAFDKFLNVIQETAKSNPDVLFMIKEHPLAQNQASVLKVLDEKNVINCNDVHYKDILDISTAVMTINSGIGLQASLIYDLPVFTYGEAFYHFDGLGIKIESEEQSKNFKSEIDNHIFDKKKSDRFLHWLLYRYYTFADLIKKDPYRNHMDLGRMYTLRMYD